MVDPFAIRPGAIIGAYSMRGAIYGVIRGAIACGILVIANTAYATVVTRVPTLVIALLSAFVGAIIGAVFGGMFGAPLGAVLGAVTVYMRRNFFYKPLMVAIALCTVIPISVLTSLKFIELIAPNKAINVLALIVIVAVLGIDAAWFGYRMATQEIYGKGKKKKNDAE
jgi:hypothetical protein